MAIYYSDIDITFNTDEYTHDFNVLYNNKDIKQSVKLLLNTNYGDRVFAPYIGSSLRDCLFMQADSISQEIISNEISTILKNYEPRITVVSIDSEYDDEHMALKVYIKYYINITKEYDEVTLNFSRIS